MDEMCRICMDRHEKDELQHSIFTEGVPESIAAEDENETDDAFDDQLRLCDVLHQITGLEVCVKPLFISFSICWLIYNCIISRKMTMDDGLPANVCHFCARRVVDAYVLRHRVEQTHNTLMELRDKQNWTLLNISASHDNIATNSTNDCGLPDANSHEILILDKKPTNDYEENVELYDVCMEPPKKRTRIANKAPRTTDLFEETVESASGRSISTVCTSFEIKFLDQTKGTEFEKQISDRDDSGSPEKDTDTKAEALYEEDEEEVDDAVAFLMSNFAIEKQTSASPKKRKSTKSIQSNDANDLDESGADDGGKNVRKHRCNVCGKMFKRNSNLVDHLRLHSNVRPFECEICKHRFVQSGNLRAHMRIHTKERPFKCQVCGKTYNQSGALKVHIRTHTNERNYKCDVCDKAFTNSSDRNKHQRVHDASVQIKCELCSKLFAQRVNYVLHMKKHHNLTVDYGSAVAAKTMKPEHDDFTAPE